MRRMHLTLIVQPFKHRIGEAALRDDILRAVTQVSAFIPAFGGVAFPTLKPPVDKPVLSKYADPLMPIITGIRQHARCHFRSESDGGLHAVRVSHQRCRICRRWLRAIQLPCTRNLPMHSHRTRVVNVRRHQLQHVRCLIDRGIPRARLNKLNRADLPFRHIAFQRKVLRMEIELRIHDELRFCLLRELRNLPPILTLHRNRFFDNRRRHPVLGCLMHQRVSDAFVRPAQHRRSHDMQQVWFLLCEHLVKIGVSGIYPELITEAVEQLFIHITNRCQFSAFDVFIGAGVSSCTSPAPQNRAFIHSVSPYPHS